LIDGKIEFEIVKQIANEPNGRCWDIDLLVNFCREAVTFAKQFSASVGIDSWGVDHGFIDKQGIIVSGPVMYRDPSHVLKFEEFTAHRAALFAATGIAHQPFNTLYQLAARAEEDPSLPGRADWLLMPDLLGFLLTGVRRYEQTQASTTQLMGTDGEWCPHAFRLAGWPVPLLQPQPCGDILGVCDGVPVVSVASHDTGSAVIGVGQMHAGDAFLNLGTWALLGVVIDVPITSTIAEQGNWTNEWTHDGKIRFLRNIPGFYVINRIHEELRIKEGIGPWLESRDKNFTGRFNPQDSALYCPESMLAEVERVCSKVPSTPNEWAQTTLASLVECVQSNLPGLETATGKVKRIRVVGGGSRSFEFCQALANLTGMEIVAGPVEATVLGNLAVQFAASGEISLEEIPELVSRSFEIRKFQPKGEQCKFD